MIRRQVSVVALLISIGTTIQEVNSEKETGGFIRTLDAMTDLFIQVANETESNTNKPVKNTASSNETYDPVDKNSTISKDKIGENSGRVSRKETGGFIKTLDAMTDLFIQVANETVSSANQPVTNAASLNKTHVHGDRNSPISQNNTGENSEIVSNYFNGDENKNLLNDTLEEGKNALKQTLEDDKETFKKSFRTEIGQGIDKKHEKIKKHEANPFFEKLEPTLNEMKEALKSKYEIPQTVFAQWGINLFTAARPHLY